MALVVKNPPAKAGDERDVVLILGLRRYPGVRNGHPVFLPGKFHGQRSLVGYSPWGHKEADTTEQLSIHTRMYICVYIYTHIYNFKILYEKLLQ